MSTGNLPHNTEAEANIIASILLNPDVLPDVVQLVQPGDFYSREYGLIYAAMLDLFKAGRDIDVVTILERLEQKGQGGEIGGRDLLITLTDAVGTTVNVLSYAEIVRDHALVRRTVNAARKIAVEGLSQSARSDVGRYLGDAERAILSIRADAMGRREVGVPVGEVVRAMAESYKQGRPAPLLSTYIGGLDELIGGLYRQEVTIIAARPSIGKTLVGAWLAFQVAFNARHPVLFVSAEMAASAIVYRMVCVHHALSGRERFNKQSWAVDSAAVGGLPVRVVDAGLITPETIRAAALSFRVADSEGRMPLIVVDYLQLLKVSGRVRSMYEKASYLSAELKRLAKDLDVPVVVLAQLNRSAETRPDRRPQVADLRDSGNIEQDADNIILLHRPGYYDQSGDAGVVQDMDLIVAKARNHKTGVVSVQVDLEWQTVIS